MRSLLEHEELRRVRRAVVLGDFLRFVVKVLERELFLLGLLLHRVEAIVGDRVHVDRDQRDLALILLGEVDDAVLVLLGARTAIAREHDDDEFLAGVIGQRVLLAVGARQILPRPAPRRRA